MTLAQDFKAESHHLQLILGAIPVGVVVVDQDLIIQAFNAAAEAITGVQASDALGQPYSEILQTQRKDITDPLQEALDTGQTFVNQRFYLRTDQDETEQLPIRHSASVLTDANGDIVGGVTIFADISRQVSLERQIKSQQRYLRDILRSVPDGVVTTDADLQIESWNRGATEVTGHPSAQVISRPCAEVLGPAVASVLETLLQNGSESIVGQQAQLPLPDGRSIPIDFSASSIERPATGNVSGTVVVFRDISERLAQQRELAQQRRYLDQVLNLAPYGIFTIDLDMKIQTFNRAAQKLTGFAGDFVLGKPYDKAFKIDPDSDTDPLPALITGGNGEIHTRRVLVDAGGEKHPISLAAATLTNIDDQLMGAIAIFQDISDIIAAERTKNEFISMVSHELRTPLTSIKGFITAVLDGKAGEINDRQRHFLSISREQSGLLLHLINDLLDLTQFESGQMDVSKGRVAISDLIDSVAETIAPLAQRKNLSFEKQVANDLPYLWADREKLFQVLQNLLSNAVKFTPLKGQVSLGAAADGDAWIVFTVSDTGIGIAPEERQRIFDPFYQVENIQTRQVGGTGLGLSIVQKIVDLHDGRIELESEVGQGTTFRVYIPRTQPARTVVRTRDDSQADLSESRADSTRARRSDQPRPVRLNPLILVVDDDPAANSLVRFLLEEEGYDVIGAENGRQALELAAAEQPDLITLDILMPEMDGFHVLEALNQDPKTADIPVCIVSIIEDKVKGYRLGAIDYITKPFESEQLVHAVQMTLKPLDKQGRNTILVVEDNPHIVELVELALADQDYEILAAHDGVAALEQLRHARPDMVLLDIMLPKLDGYEFIRQAKANPLTEHIPIVVLSVRSLEEDINRALRLGAEKYLVKPADGAEDLTRVIGDAIHEFLDKDDTNDGEEQ
jgi:hypothetical protein